jgi:hypothetical protein
VIKRLWFWGMWPMTCGLGTNFLRQVMDSPDIKIQHPGTHLYLTKTQISSASTSAKPGIAIRANYTHL